MVYFEDNYFKDWGVDDKWMINLGCKGLQWKKTNGYCG